MKRGHCQNVLHLRILKTGPSACRCSMTLEWTKRGNSQCISKFLTSQELHGDIHAGALDILGPGIDRKWYGTLSYSLEAKWDSIATRMVGRTIQRKWSPTKFVFSLLWKESEFQFRWCRDIVWYELEELVQLWFVPES